MSGLPHVGGQRACFLTLYMKQGFYRSWAQKQEGMLQGMGLQTREG